MKTILTVLILLCVSSASYAQVVSFTSWSINNVSPGGEIVFTKGVSKQLSIVANLQKPNNLVVGDGTIKLVTKAVQGSQEISMKIADVPEGFWSLGTSSNPVFLNMTPTTINLLLDFTAAARLVFVTNNGTEYQSDNSLNFKVILPPPVANAGFDKIIYCSQSTILDGSATGGSPPYSYSWSPSMSNQSHQTQQALHGKQHLAT